MIATAQSQIRPLSKIEGYVKLATDGFDIFKSILNFFVSMNVVWILTSLHFVNQAKRRLYVVLFLGFVSEILTILNAENEVMDHLGGIDMIVTVRYWTRGFCLTVWLISCLISCICPSKDDTDQYATQMEELLRNQMDFVTQLNAAKVESMLAAQKEASKETINRGRSIRKYHPSSRRSRSRGSRSPKTVVTPFNPKHSSEAKRSREHDTIKILKELQRSHVNSDAESSSESSSSHGCNQNSSTSRTSSKRGRKRKFSDTGNDTQNAMVLDHAQRDDFSISSVLTESSSSHVDSKKHKASDVAMD